jgi:putative nucleotidyltransferase with HDIG domain
MKISSYVLEAVEALTAAGGKRDQITALHQDRTAGLAVRIARRLGIDGDRLEGIRISGILHDIGKLGVPSEILSKPGALDEDERRVVMRHSRFGWEILKGLSFPWPVADIILDHHECLDGSGYPAGKRGDDIAIESRIVSVADVAEALTSHRPYRSPLAAVDIVEFLQRHRDTKFDASVVEACVEIIEVGGLQAVAAECA